MKSQSGQSTVLVIIVGVVAVLIGLMLQSINNRPVPLPEFRKTIILLTPRVITADGLLDHKGQAFGLEQLSGKWNIVFFGFTNCPDICPTTMQTLSQVKKQLETSGAWNNYRVIMVSVDPKRDTTERLANYVPYFDSEFIGLSASVEDTQEFAKQVGILFSTHEPDENGSYDVDHSTSIILINPAGQYAGVIPTPHKADEISADLQKLAEFSGPMAKDAAPKTVAIKAPLPSNDAATGAAPASNLKLEEAWIRPAPSSAKSMAAYFEIRNASNKDINIVRSSSSAFNMAMIHNTVIESGMASMEQLESLLVPAGGLVRLSPMATHMMLVGPKQHLKLGDIVPITLVDEDGQNYTYQIQIRDLGE